MFTEFGEIYDFSPKSFIMPEDYVKFVSEHSKRQERPCLEARNIVLGSELTADSCCTHNVNDGYSMSTLCSQKASSAALQEWKKSASVAKIRCPIWIIKPIGIIIPIFLKSRSLKYMKKLNYIEGKSQGRGIILTTDIGLVASAHRCVVQEYIARPHLIGGYKWDM